MTCGNCGLHPSIAAGRCHACHKFKARNEKERPYELIRRQLQREVAKQHR